LAEEFVESQEWKKVAARTITKPIQMIGHCRWPTQGSPLNNDNNHPIVCGRIVGIHNGCIGNDSTLFDSYAGDFERIAEVDSEIIFQLINSYNEELQDMADAIRTTAGLLTGSYACAAINAENPYMLWLFRNGSPCEIIEYSKGVIIFSTSERFIKKAMKGTDFGKETKIELDRNSGIGINLFNNTFFRFSTKSDEIATRGCA
jgi:glucosamine 6-phosphate synthetase-like amidotransferase/phosphosugar isomerase protein